MTFAVEFAPRLFASLFVEARGPFVGVSGVDPWDAARDARLYAGPHPVVAHPPCARWGRYARGGPSHPNRYEIGDDGGCFASALAAVRRWGGVLEHPAGSLAWARHGLFAPPRAGGWIVADDVGGWTCCVEQAHYGHAARKPTWLYACGVRTLPSLTWGAFRGAVRAVLDRSGRTTADRVAKAASQRAAGVVMLSARKRCLTPIPFRDVLLGIARGAR